MWEKSVRDCLAARSGFSFSCASLVISYLLVLLVYAGLWESISCLYTQLNLPRRTSSILWSLFGHQGDFFQMLIRFCSVFFHSAAQPLAQKVGTHGVFFLPLSTCLCSQLSALSMWAHLKLWALVHISSLSRPISCLRTAAKLPASSELGGDKVSRPA